MQLGIFAKTFAAQGAAPVLKAVRAAGFDTAQFNMACLGLPSMPDDIALDTAKQIAMASITSNVSIAAISGTYNMAHPDPAIRADWSEGLTLYGEHGSVNAKTYNPWYYKSSDVEIFHEKDATYRRPLGADGHFYRRQLEGFADVILDGAAMRGADIHDGITSVRAMVAVAQSVRTGQSVRLADVSGLV